MRLITIGCEYSGKTTLADALREWGVEHGRPFHMDDADFSIPDVRHLDEEEQQVMASLPHRIKGALSTLPDLLPHRRDLQF